VADGADRIEGTRAVARAAEVGHAHPPADIDVLQRRIARLEQQLVDPHDTIAQRDEELDAARGANRELTADLNRRTSLTVP
jgi:hypothetical protein